MEGGANNYGVLDKKSIFNEGENSMKLKKKSEPVFPDKSCMMTSCLDANNDFLGHFYGGAGNDDGGGHLVPSTCIHGGGNEVAGNAADLDYSTLLASRSALNKFSGGGMAASMAFPFTSAQRKELERQAMIYKYMLASVPVPPDLLFPASTLPRNFFHSPAPGFNNVSYSRNGDPEPGRCKRTDGKKWRCSKEAAPLQKYCERHLQRGRSRSRKHVEDKNDGETQKKTRLTQTLTDLPNMVQEDSSSCHHFATAYEPHMLFNTKADRDSSMIREGEMVELGGGGEQQKWQSLMAAQMGLANGSFHRGEHLEQPWNRSFSAPGTEASAGFYDAWSVRGGVNSNVQLSDSLDLSMANAAGKSHNEGKDSRYLSNVSWDPFSS